MIRRAVLLGFLAVVVTTLPVYADGNANFILGSRMFDEDDWEPVEDQGVFGVDVDFGRPDWPVHIDIGFHVSTAEDDFFDPFFSGDVDVTVTVTEISAGVLKVWNPGNGNVRPFIGGGLAAINGEVEFDVPGIGDIDEDDTTGAIYGRGGVYWRIGSRFNIGVDGRILGGSDLEVDGLEVDTNYLQVGVLLGWGWPAE